jgi:hypothetical protein
LENSRKESTMIRKPSMRPMTISTKGVLSMAKKMEKEYWYKKKETIKKNM